MTLTPPGVAAAPLGRRAGAYAIDAVIAGLIGALAMGLGAVFVAIGGSPANAVTAAVGVMLAYLFTMAVLFAWTMVYTAMQAGTGSIGQRLLHIALADAQTGERIGFWRALLRNIVWAAACSIVVGYFTPLFDGSARHRGWHDLASGAVVVDRAAAAPAASQLFAAPAAAPAAPSNPFLAASASAPAAEQTDPFFAALRGGSAPAEEPVPVPAVSAANPFVAASAAPGSTAPPTTFPTMRAGSVADLTHTDPVQDAATAAPAPQPVPAGRVLPVTSGIISSVPGTSSAAVAPAESLPSVEYLPVPEPVEGSSSSGGDDPSLPTHTPLAAGASSGASGRAAPSSGTAAERLLTAARSAASPFASAAASLVSTTDDEDLDATRASAPAAASARARLALVWDDGTHTAIYARTVFGRNPAADGATAVAVRDETLSLSKTHFEVDAGTDGTWITDRHSTNGTVVLRGGTETTLAAGERFRLQAGDRVEIGDRSITVEAVA
ncbi:RDD family protein [Microbacterium sp. ASV49]|uniref:RDD family protein n=1 Tax=Microbacterium candidum TaxID=3041922 RepID=A0ABT7MUS0_9MICO|nr:RDD family protein [Microbacterium sp. ASV49]MDL9978201.1 RDD family protein [Microbacterium sp. ASV49]